MCQFLAIPYSYVLIEYPCIFLLQPQSLPLQLLNSPKMMYMTWRDIPLLLKFCGLLDRMHIVEVPIRFQFPLALCHAFRNSLFDEESWSIFENSCFLLLFYHLLCIHILGLWGECKCLVTVDLFECRYTIVLWNSWEYRCLFLFRLILTGIWILV